MARAIVNAKDKRPGPFPQVGAVLSGWQNQMTFIKVIDTVDDFEVVKYEVPYKFYGVFQAQTPQQLFLKAEGQRNWKWWTLWTKTELDIINGDIIEDFNGKRYKVMRTNDWSQGGYVQHEMIEMFDNTGASPGQIPPAPPRGGLFIQNGKIYLRYSDGSLAQEWDE